MGNEETETPSKLPKSSSAQEQPPADSPATVFPDWASFQAYYNSGGSPQIPPPAFFHSPVASSPQAHPYIWGPHMVPPYGATPPPFVAMYPHGGLYAHPSIPAGSHPYGPYTVPSSNGTAEASISTAGGGEVEGKSGEEKGKSPLKRSKGSLGSLSMLTGKGSDTGKASGASANGGLSQSGESGSEGSSEGSDASSQNGSQQKLSSEKGSVHAFAQNGGTASPPTHTMLNSSMVMAMPPNGVSGPTTNLNIGMDYWGGQAPNPVATSRAKLPVVLGTASMVPSSQIGSHDGVSPELWIQDERELKRQRRKQSNRESARRSRLRKQAECEELAQRVETLTEENSSLREELECLREKRENLGSENASLSEKLQNIQGRDLGVDSINGHPDPNPQTEADI